MEPTGLLPLIQVYDMNEAVRFYRDVLGFGFVDHSPEIDAPEGRYFHWCWLRHGPVELMLNTAYDAGERPPARDPSRETGHGDTILYIGCKDVDAAYDLLRSRGVDCKPPSVAPYGMKQLVVKDPDGYMLCFQAPA